MLQRAKREAARSISNRTRFAFTCTQKKADMIWFNVLNFIFIWLGDIFFIGNKFFLLLLCTRSFKNIGSIEKIVISQCRNIKYLRYWQFLSVQRMFGPCHLWQFVAWLCLQFVYGTCRCCFCWHLTEVACARTLNFGVLCLFEFFGIFNKCSNISRAKSSSLPKSFVCLICNVFVSWELQWCSQLEWIPIDSSWLKH